MSAALLSDVGFGLRCFIVRKLDYDLIYQATQKNILDIMPDAISDAPESSFRYKTYWGELAILMSECLKNRVKCES